MTDIKKPVWQTIIALTAGALIAYGWFATLLQAGSWASLNGYGQFSLMAQHLSGMVFLLAVSIPYHRWVAPLGIGHVLQRSSVMPALAVIAVYLAEYGYGKITVQPPEKWVEALLNKQTVELAAVFLTIFILAPVSEEILFRGVLLNIFRSSRPWTMWVGVVLIALLFAAIHHQYQNMSTLLEMMALSCIFAWARMRSGGLLLPVLLHSLASMMAIILTLLG